MMEMVFVRVGQKNLEEEDKMEKEVSCLGCGIIRFEEIDSNESEKECRLTAKSLCSACSCPYVKLVNRGKEFNTPPPAHWPKQEKEFNLKDKEIMDEACYLTEEEFEAGKKEFNFYQELQDIFAEELIGKGVSNSGRAYRRLRARDKKFIRLLKKICCSVCEEEIDKLAGDDLI